MSNSEQLLKQLTDSFDAIAQNHLQKPDMYYLGKGDIGVCALCQKTLEILHNFRVTDFYRSDCAVPNYPILVRIHDFLQLIQRYYSDHESELWHVFVKAIAPSTDIPLRQEVLQSMSLCSAMIFIHDQKFQKRPIPAHIDGYYDLVASVSDNELRIPLLNDDKKATILPPSLTFFAQESEERAAQEFIVQKAGDKGRNSQFHAFMSLIAKSDPRDGLMHMLRCAISHEDLSFAIAFCVCSREPSAMAQVSHLLNLLAVDGLIDHFLRSLCCSVRKIVIGDPPVNHIELTALINCWVASSIEWLSQLPADGGIVPLIENVCRNIRYGEPVPALAMYILRCALTIAAYDEDRCGNAAIAMFLELAIFPLARKFNLDDQFRSMKYDILSTKGELYTEISKTIVSVLGKEISFVYFPRKVEPDLPRLYKHALDNVDTFVELLMVMNSRSLYDNPPLQSVLFALEHATEVSLLV